MRNGRSVISKSHSSQPAQAWFSVTVVRQRLKSKDIVLGFAVALTG